MNIKTNLTLSAEDADTIKNFVRDNFSNDSYFIDNGNSRRYSSLTKFETPISDLAKRIRNESFKSLGILSFEEENIYGIFLGVNGEGGFVQPHRDQRIDGHEHFRLNFLISKPDGGGMPVINGKEYNIDEGESWINIASRWAHMSTPVVGKKNRIVLSLGGQVKIEDVDLVFSSLNKYI
jgi:hypothetical protein